MDPKLWIAENAGSITHFRPRKIGGSWWLFAYNRNATPPLLNHFVSIPDTDEITEHIRVTCGPGKIEEVFS